MKIFSLKRIIGLAAIGGAVAYARKNGGFKNAFNGLLEKGKALAGDMNKKADSMSSSSGFKSESTVTPPSYMKNGFDQH
ncbi:MAG: hypothetical protein ABI867_08085 [Kofleriaceae bacterium]